MPSTTHAQADEAKSVTVNDFFLDAEYDDCDVPPDTNGGWFIDNDYNFCGVSADPREYTELERTARPERGDYKSATEWKEAIFAWELDLIIVNKPAEGTKPGTKTKKRSTGVNNQAGRGTKAKGA